MATPSSKSPEIAQLLEGFSGRTTAIEADKCINPPIGCGQAAIEFGNYNSWKEYTISGLCQECQDKMFGS